MNVNCSFINLIKKLFLCCLILASITNTWRKVFDSVLLDFGGWPSLQKTDKTPHTKIERLYGIMVAKFRADSLFKATVQPDDKNSKKHILLVIFLFKIN